MWLYSPDPTFCTNTVGRGQDRIPYVCPHVDNLVTGLKISPKNLERVFSNQGLTHSCSARFAG